MWDNTMKETRFFGKTWFLVAWFLGDLAMPYRKTDNQSLEDNMQHFEFDWQTKDGLRLYAQG
jgi:hypothetical protein